MAQALPFVILSVITGEETWQSRSASFRVFTMKTPDGVASERPLYVASKECPEYIKAAGGRNIHGTKPGRKTELGKWTQGTYDVASGTLLKIVASTSAENHGERSKRIQKIIRVRHTAPLQKLSLQLPRVEGRIGNDAHVYGRFDVITLEEAELAGAVVHPRFRGLFDDAFGDVVDVVEIEPEIAPLEVVKLKKVVTSTGQTTVIDVQRRRRQMGFTETAVDKKPEST